MEAASAESQSKPEERADGLTGAPEALDRAAQDRPVSEEMEKSVLDFLLGKTHRSEADVKVELDTPAGLRSLSARIRALDERTMERIDAENRSGDGPFSRLDRAGANAGLLAEAVVHFEDPESGRKVDPRTEEFLGGAANPAVAIEGRFKYQPGLLEALAEEVRKISAYNPERVGTAQRVVQAAVGNSSGAGGS